MKRGKAERIRERNRNERWKNGREKKKSDRVGWGGERKGTRRSEEDKKGRREEEEKVGQRKGKK